MHISLITTLLPSDHCEYISPATAWSPGTVNLYNQGFLSHITYITTLTLHVNPISFRSPVYIPVLCPGSVWCLSLDLHVSCWFLSNLIFYLESLLICYSCWHSHFPFLIVRRIHIHHIFPHWFVRSGKRVVCMYSVENIRQNTAAWLFIGKYTNIESWALCIRISKLLSLWAPLFSLSLFDLPFLSSSYARQKLVNEGQVDGSHIPSWALTNRIN